MLGNIPRLLAWHTFTGFLPSIYSFSPIKIQDPVSLENAPAHFVAAVCAMPSPGGAPLCLGHRDWLRDEGRGQSGPHRDREIFTKGFWLRHILRLWALLEEMIQSFSGLCSRQIQALPGTATGVLQPGVMPASRGDGGQGRKDRRHRLRALKTTGALDQSVRKFPLPLFFLCYMSPEIPFILLVFEVPQNLGSPN